MKQFKIAICGLGARGYDTYAQYQKLYPQKMKIVAIADVDGDKLQRAANEFGVPSDMCFGSAEELLSKPKLADIAFITTNDQMHVSHAVSAMKAGYDLLLEKPISNLLDGCLKIWRAAKEYNKTVVVCHVLRYSLFYKTIKELMPEIGKPVAIQAIEKVGYWHQAHSFVRGNWRNSEKTSPMILQKCCHDFDIFAYLLEKKCLSASSFGSLSFFKKENRPKGAADQCCNCGIEDCPYNAVKFYIGKVRKGQTAWPCNVVTPKPTEDSMMKALNGGPYGKCVFDCDNNVVDHQVVNFLFEDDVTVNFTMSAFTANCAREIRIMGTHGEIYGNQGTNKIVLALFGKPSTEYDITKIAKDLSGHGGGENAMLTAMFDNMEKHRNNIATVIDNSIQSHIMAFAAERSRVHGGEPVMLEDLFNGAQPQ